MAENREEVLSQLYALRGSISYMSGNIGPLLRKEAEQIPVTREKEKNYYLLKDGYYNGEMSQEFKIDYDDALRRSNSADERMERAKRYYANRYITEHTEENLAVYIKRKKNRVGDKYSNIIDRYIVGCIVFYRIRNFAACNNRSHNDISWSVADVIEVFPNKK